MVPPPTTEGVRKSPRTNRTEAIERRNKAIDERNKAIDAKKVPAARKNLNEKPSVKSKKRQKTVSTKPKSPDNAVDIALKEKNKKSKQPKSESPNAMDVASKTTNQKRKKPSPTGAVSKTVKTRRSSEGTSEALPTAEELPEKRRDHTDYEGKHSKSGTGWGTNTVRRKKKRLSEVATVLATRGKGIMDHSESDDSEQKDVDDSYIVDMSEDDASGDHESSSEEEDVMVVDDNDESESSSQRRADEMFRRRNREIHDGRHEVVVANTGHKTAAVQPSRLLTEDVQTPTIQASST